MGTQIMADHNNFFFILDCFVVYIDRNYSDCGSARPICAFSYDICAEKKAHLRLKVAPVCALFK